MTNFMQMFENIAA